MKIGKLSEHTKALKIKHLGGSCFYNGITCRDLYTSYECENFGFMVLEGCAYKSKQSYENQIKSRQNDCLVFRHGNHDACFSTSVLATVCCCSNIDFAKPQ